MNRIQSNRRRLFFFTIIFIGVFLFLYQYKYGDILLIDQAQYISSKPQIVLPAEISTSVAFNSGLINPKVYHKNRLTLTSLSISSFDIIYKNGYQESKLSKIKDYIETGYRKTTYKIRPLYIKWLSKDEYIQLKMNLSMDLLIQSQMEISWNLLKNNGFKEKYSVIPASFIKMFEVSSKDRNYSTFIRFLYGNLYSFEKNHPQNGLTAILYIDCHENYMSFKEIFSILKDFQNQNRSYGKTLKSLIDKIQVGINSECLTKKMDSIDNQFYKNFEDLPVKFIYFNNPYDTEIRETISLNPHNKFFILNSIENRRQPERKLDRMTIVSHNVQWIREWIKEKERLSG